jgi:dTDP-4-dehydrorhamnose reductase
MVVAADPRWQLSRRTARVDGMRILVTGRSGQLARSLVESIRNHPGFELVAFGRPDLDLGVPGSAEDIILRQRPDFVINTAADTDVDAAEEHKLHAFRLNAEAAGEVAAAASAVGAPIIQLSTDYVFDGASTHPYAEDAPTRPLNAYGHTKLAGEEAVRAGNPEHLILRTAWVYSPFGRNFVKTMFDAAGERDELRVVADQRGNPTSALDLADALLRVIEAWQRSEGTGRGEIYHLAGTGEASRHELAGEVMRRRRELGLRVAELVPISFDDWPMRAVRPKYSVLDSAKFARDFGFRLPDWHQSVGEVVNRLAAERRGGSI